MPAQFVFLPSQLPQQTQCIDYEIVDDDVLEGVETFFVEISTSVPRVMVGRSVSTVSLVDDDGVYVTLVQRELTVVENDAAGGGTAGQFELCVQMTGIIQTEVEIRLFTEAGTAQGKTPTHTLYTYVMYYVLCMHLSLDCMVLQTLLSLSLSHVS